MSIELRSPTTTTAPVAGTTAGLFTFATPAGKLAVRNATGVTVYLRFNSASDASTTTFDLALESRETSWTLDPDDVGVQDFSTVSAWIPAGGAVASFSLRGQ